MIDDDDDEEGEVGGPHTLLLEEAFSDVEAAGAAGVGVAVVKGEIV